MRTFQTAFVTLKLSENCREKYLLVLLWHRAMEQVEEVKGDGYLHSSHRTQSLCNRISEDDVECVGFGIGHHGLPQLTAIRSISGGAQG